METGRRRSIPESIQVHILARLPLRSITRFKSVCKQWRSLIESSYFRSLFVSLHPNSSPSWSLMFNRAITEAIGFHGCSTWALPKSPASYITPFQHYPNLNKYLYVDSSHGLIWLVAIASSGVNLGSKSFVGNPISQDWVQIPPQPPGLATMPVSLVSRVVHGVVLSFKYFFISIFKIQCRVIPLPVMDDKDVRRCLSSSGGDVVYVEVLRGRFNVWKMKKSDADGEWWELTRGEINMGFDDDDDGDCFPLGVNPFDADLVYLWSREHSRVGLGNLRTREFTLYQEKESEGSWLVNMAGAKEFMGSILYDPASVITLSQFVLPQWIDPLPRPPN